MNHTELISRIGDLEGMLEALVRESDAVTETLKAQVSDLSQQVGIIDNFPLFCEDRIRYITIIFYCRCTGYKFRREMVYFELLLL